MTHNYVFINDFYTPGKLIMSGTFTVEELYDAGQKIHKKISLVSSQMNIGRPQDTALPDDILNRIQ